MNISGKKILVTAGPTHESVDPVRFIGNHSSGKMGYAIAEAFANQGCEVILVSGPTNIDINNKKINKIQVTTAEEMYNECIKHFNLVDITVMAAAVADFTPINKSSNKIKKSENNFIIELIPTKDILKELGVLKKAQQLLVGFALETNDEIVNAKKKLHNKNLDLIVLNSLKDKGAGFGFNTNKISIIDRNNKITTFGLKDKSEVAIDIVEKITEQFNNYK